MATNIPLLKEPGHTDDSDLRNIILSAPRNLELHQNELISALGGMDGILIHYIDNGLLDTQQLESIKSVLVGQSSPGNQHSDTMDRMVSQSLPTYGTIVLNEDNTILHQMFSVERAECIIKYLYHRFTISIALIYSVVHAVISAYEWLAGGHKSMVQHVGALFATIFICDVLLIAHCALITLSGNRKAFFLCVKSFEFWIKLLYAVQVMVASSIYVIFDKHLGVWAYIGRTGRYLLVVAVTVLYSTVDGLPLDSTIKTAFGIVFACYVSVYAVYETFLGHSFFFEFAGMTVDILDIMASSNRVLSIFLWKQAILSTLKQGKAQIISTWINIEWIKVTPKSVALESIDQK